MALSPDGRHALVSNDGLARQSVMLVDTGTNTVTAKIDYAAPKAVFLGVAWRPDGTRAYVSAGANDLVVVRQDDRDGVRGCHGAHDNSASAWRAALLTDAWTTYRPLSAPRQLLRTDPSSMRSGSSRSSSTAPRMTTLAPQVTSPRTTSRSASRSDGGPLGKRASKRSSSL